MQHEKIPSGGRHNTGSRRGFRLLTSLRCRAYSPVETYSRIAAYLQRERPSRIAGTAVLSPYLALSRPDYYFTIWSSSASASPRVMGSSNIVSLISTPLAIRLSQCSFAGSSAGCSGSSGSSSGSSYGMSSVFRMPFA